MLDRAGELTCSACGTRYPSVDGIPILVEHLSDQHRSQRAYFDAEFERYKAYTVENWRRSFLRRIFPALRVRSGVRYLDVGVGGSGATVIEAARLGARAVGCDLSLPGVRSAREFAERERVRDRADFVVCAAERLPFGDGSFDCASAIAVLEHLDDDNAAARELARIVRPGGRIWITVPHAYRYMPPPVWPLYWWHDRRIGHRRHYRARELSTLFAESGVRPVVTAYSAHPVKLAQFLLSRLVRSMNAPASELWWRLERLDERARRRALGALQLNMVFERPADAATRPPG